MKTKIKQPKQASTIQSKTKAANQASIQTVLQKYKAPVAQREITEEDDLLQGKIESTAQLMELPEEEEEPLQGKFGSMENGQSNVERVQKKEDPGSTSQTPLPAKNETGLPNQLKSGVENMSGLAMDAVRVHYNSPKPAQLQALAYTQGTDIHVAPGQEKHLPHEAWHVVQQMQGRVQPTMQLQGVNVNDNEGLEREADVMGERAVQRKKYEILGYKYDPANKGSDVTKGAKNQKQKAESGLVKLGCNDELMSAHMIPKRLGGKGGLTGDNIRPWLLNFEQNIWNNGVDSLSMAKDDIINYSVITEDFTSTDIDKKCTGKVTDKDEKNALEQIPMSVEATVENETKKEKKDQPKTNECCPVVLRKQAPNNTFINSLLAIGIPIVLIPAVIALYFKFFS